ncbi:MAG: hypothetical protein HDT43_04955 [Ruminococcaceae bacterium]|nr:hypothetical protein [Oscillospiraceae bacterium]
MSEEKLIWGASYIDDDLVCEAIDYKPRRIRLAPLACAAAAAVVLVTAFSVFARQIGSSPVLPPDSADSSYSEDISSATPPEQAVDIGDGMTLTGTPLDNSELEEFSIENYFGGAYWSTEQTFLDDLGVPELKDVYMRMDIMQGTLNTMSIKRPSAVTANGRTPARIKTADGTYEELGYTYESFYNAYLSAFTKETTEGIFNNYLFMDYNGALFCQDAAKGSMIGEVHREYELLRKSDELIQFGMVTYYDRNFELQREYDPALRDEYVVAYTDFKFVMTEDGWRSENIPKETYQNSPLTGTPLDSSELEEFSVETHLGDGYLTEEDEEFIDSLEIPELKNLCRRALCLTQYSLSTCNVPHTSAVTANNRKVPYIELEKDGWSIQYYETGYTYESFYNEYLRAFTKETIEEMFKEYDVFLDYNGELFCSDGARGGWLGEVHREYELNLKTDTAVEFRILTFHSDSDGNPAPEYIPEYRDKYGLGITEFKFVLTENGWRTASIPKEGLLNLPEEKDDPITPFTPSDGVQAYADIFEEFVPENPTTYGPPLTAAEEMDSLLPNPDYPEYDVDSYYLVEVIRALTNEEYMQMNGWKDSIGGSGFTVYEVNLVEDLISGEAPDRTEFVRIPAGFGARTQKRNDPAYAPGERFTAVLTKPYKDNDYVISVGDYCLRYDLPQMSFTENDEETMLYFRGNGLARHPIPDLPFETEDINIAAAYSTPQNPATYIQKIALDDLVDFLRSEWKNRGISSHFEEHPVAPIID